MLDDDWVSPVKPDPYDPRDHTIDIDPDPQQVSIEAVPDSITVVPSADSFDDVDGGFESIIVVPDPVASSALPDVPVAVPYDYYAKHAEPAWWQRGEECTGFALAAIANHLIRTQVSPDEPSVSPRMMYEMAQEYDGEAYEEGSTLRGALKGWAKLGVSSIHKWPYDPDDEHGEIYGTLDLGRVADAGLRPMGAYRRIRPHTDIQTMQATLASQTPMFASARLHTGWFRLYLPGTDAVIVREATDKDKGGHAFVIVGYDERGFWIHNSFGEDWGHDGFGLIPYDDWQTDGGDVWVPGLGLMEPTTPPIIKSVPAATDDHPEPPKPDRSSAVHKVMWPHVIPFGDDGRVSTSSGYTVDAQRVKTLFYIFGEETRAWKTPRLAVIADSGLDPADIDGHLLELRKRLMDEEIYPIFLVWDTAWLPSMEREVDKTMMGDGSSLGDLFVEVGLPKTNAIELWKQVTRRAHLAVCRSCEPEAGGRLIADSIQYKFSQRPFEIHLLSHSTGDLLLSELAQYLPSPIHSASLLVPATPMKQFQDTYAPMLADGCLRSMNITALDTNSETGGTVASYGQSPLALISNVLAIPGVDSPDLHHFGPEGEAPEAASLAETEAWFLARKLDPEPLLGLEADLRRDPLIRALRQAGSLSVDFVLYGLTHQGVFADNDTLSRVVARMTRSGPPADLPEAATPAETAEIQVIIELPAGDPLTQVAEVD